jgi:thiol:disulfide interchange protein DsbD
MLKEMPKSGGWLNSVKVVLGFVELILSLKFLSVADMAYGWRLLDREVFVAIWIVLFILLGAYLLGKIRFSHYSEQSHVGVFRFFLATISLAFAVYLLPGLWGAPLKAVSAFVPPLETQDFNLYSHSDNYVELDDYDEAMTYAAENHKPVLIDFSGYGCVNCRNMEAEVFDTDQVRSYLKDNFVVVKLMVDDRAKLFTPITVDIDGKVTTLETVGEKWSYLQMHKFGANSQPYYIVLDNEGRPMNDPVYYDNNIDSFMNWLKTGLNNYKTQK